MTLRRDYRYGPLHIIRRPYHESPQYGLLLWRAPYSPLTLDIWVKQILWTLRWDNNNR